MDTQTLKKSFALEGMILAVTAASLFAEPAKPVEPVSPEKKFVVKVDAHFLPRLFSAFNAGGCNTFHKVFLAENKQNDDGMIKIVAVVIVRL